MSVGRKGRSRRGGHEQGGHDGPDERWAVSYSDMVTVLMCLFIVLFAMSTIDQNKYEELRDSLADGFGTTPSEIVVITPEEQEGDGYSDTVDEAVKEHETMSGLRSKLQEALNRAGLSGAASFTIDERGLTVGLVSTEMFFVTNSTDLNSNARAVLAAIGPVLAGDPHDMSIEGHADYRNPVGQPFETNWELSSGRATSVLRDLVEVRGVTSGRVKAVGFGSTRPLVDGKTDAELAKNRRVEVIILSDAPQDVRDLLPQIEQQKGTAK